MLLTPFSSGVLLARAVDWSLPLAAVAIVTVFLLREPLIVLARQRWVWRDHRPEAAVALRWALAESAVLGVVGAALLWLWPWQAVAGFAAAAGLLTALAVWMTVKNRQRSIVLQLVSAAGLASSSLAVSVAATGGIWEWAVWLWTLCTAHAVASILVVHARLETRVMLRSPGAVAVSARPAWIAQCVLLAGALACFALGRYWLGVALGLSVAAHVFDLRRLAEAVPLRTVGLRALGLSIGFALVVVAGLWSSV